MKASAVMNFIQENFEADKVTITDFPLFPYGKKVTDKNGDEMVVFYDLLTDRVKWVFPDRQNKGRQAAGDENLSLEQRVSQLEKEMADLKRQLEERPKYIKIPLSAIKFDDQFYNIERLGNEQVMELVNNLEDELEKRIKILISFGQ